MDYKAAPQFSMTSMKSSGFTDPFQYNNQTGAVLQMRNSYSTVSREMLISGKLALERIEMQNRVQLNAKSSYLLNGKLLSYEDGHAGSDLQYDKNGCLTQDKVRRSLEYDTRGRLRAVHDAAGKKLCSYQYDATGKLSVLASVQAKNTAQVSQRKYTLYGFSTGGSPIGLNGQWRDPITA
ncbi:hypothetical protein EYZ11_012720 [Aspergillus tanneri]|uniref:Uncharacterized protein n=1 Tax=Aspergillus tanneri TaxID=1220188 RepID=A0A4S3IZI4_9EURO|nr:hypothetical protein EYZ11_012720 [Aspergillus tanneri]